MSNLKEYFERNAYQAQYAIGDRVFGHFNKIPFIGTVGNDTLISEIDGPRISVHLDLPLVFEGQVLNIVIVKHRNIKPLKNYD